MPTAGSLRLALVVSLTALVLAPIAPTAAQAPYDAQTEWLRGTWGSAIGEIAMVVAHLGDGDTDPEMVVTSRPDRSTADLRWIVADQDGAGGLRQVQARRGLPGQLRLQHSIDRRWRPRPRRRRRGDRLLRRLPRSLGRLAAGARPHHAGCRVRRLQRAGRRHRRRRNHRARLPRQQRQPLRRRRGHGREPNRAGRRR